MTHDDAWTRLPDLLADRDQPELLGHLAACHECQRQLFMLGRVDRALRAAAAPRRIQSQRKRPGRWLRLPTGLVAAAAAVAAALILLPGHHGEHQFTLRAASGEPIGRAILDRADTRNVSLTLVARGLPARAGDVYVLWAAGGNHTEAVGRFMVDPSGGCRARFNLPEQRGWTRFWVTPPGQPHTVVAAT